MKSLSNELVGKIVRPRKNFVRTWNSNFPNKEEFGTVVAVWQTQQDRLMVAVRTQDGSMGEFHIVDLAMGME
jgi:hypothetical protein